MKKLFTIVIAIVATLFYCSAQEVDNQNSDAVLRIGENTVSVNNGRLSLVLNGTSFEIGEKSATEQSGVEAYNEMLSTINTDSEQKNQKVYGGFMGIGAPWFNHFAACEFGTSALVGLDFDGYTQDDANAMMFNNSKAFSYSINLGTINVPITKSRSFVFSLAWGFTIERYTFMYDYTLKLLDGVIRPVALEEGYSKSQMEVSLFHLPMTLDWNISRSVFISAGLNFDILLGSSLIYQKPRTIVQNSIPVNPVQVGATARVGWKRLYGFVNYSFMDMYKRGTGPGGKRLSVGVGIWF